jgi:hypothetical protein
MSGKHHAEPGSHRARKADEHATRSDPHGAGTARESARHEPKGTPSSERHKAETATIRESEAPRQEKR